MRGRGRRQPFDGRPSVEGKLRRMGELLAAIGGKHPERAGSPEERPFPSDLVGFPQLERTKGHLGEHRMDSVCGAHDTGLSTGAGPGVAGTPRVHKRYARAATGELERGPAAEGASPEDGDTQPVFRGRGNERTPSARRRHEHFTRPTLDRIEQVRGAIESNALSLALERQDL